MQGQALSLVVLFITSLMIGRAMCIETILTMVGYINDSLSFQSSISFRQRQARYYIKSTATQNLQRI